MGAPVKIRAREDSCTGAGECTSRPMTEQEMLKYYTKEEIEKMSKKIDPPSKEKLIEVLAEVEGKTKALYHAVKVFSVSAPVISRWIKEYGIEFDADGRVTRNEKGLTEFEVDLKISEIEIPKPIINDAGDIVLQGEVAFKETDKVVIDGNNITNDGKAMAENIICQGNTITITGQETTKKHYKVGYAEYDIGNAFVQIDFRKEIVNFSEGMSFEEAEAAIELLSEIL